MTKVDLSTQSRTLDTIALTRRGKAVVVVIPDAHLIFWEEVLAGVLLRSNLYILDKIHPPAFAAFIHSFMDLHGAIQIRVAGSDFDFMVGTVLTHAGLLLARAPQETKP